MKQHGIYSERIWEIIQVIAVIKLMTLQKGWKESQRNGLEENKLQQSHHLNVKPHCSKLRKSTLWKVFRFPENQPKAATRLLQ